MTLSSFCSVNIWLCHHLVSEAKNFMFYLRMHRYFVRPDLIFRASQVEYGHERMLNRDA